jgi:hypothetical protein
MSPVGSIPMQSNWVQIRHIETPALSPRVAAQPSEAVVSQAASGGPWDGRRRLDPRAEVRDQLETAFQERPSCNGPSGAGRR